MDMITAIQGRRSVRSYAPEKLDEKTIRHLLEAAVLAPTAIHEEPWAFVVLQDRNILKRISDRAEASFSEEARRLYHERGRRHPDRFSNEDFSIFYDAGTLIVICGKTPGKFVGADCWLAAENLMLAAHSMGLGTCVIGSAVQPLNAPDIKAELGIAEEMTVHVPVIVGVPLEIPPPTSRKPPEILFWK